jgi:hypothetical protein
MDGGFDAGAVEVDVLKIERLAQAEVEWNSLLLTD